MSWNLNGIRAAARKGLSTFMSDLKPDVLMMQEIRALPEQLTEEWRSPADWHVHWHPAEKKGYAGTATWSKQPQELLGLGMDAPDPQGRILRTRSHGVQLINVYLPSGSSSDERQQFKERFMDQFLPWAQQFTTLSEPVIIAGDLNIAHTEDDIHNPKGNKKSSGFLPHERAWITQLLASGWVDVVRRDQGEGKGPYSWWSNRGRARELDRGWRIDYLLCNQAAAKRVRSTETHRQGGLVVSDHAPIVVVLD